jgi:hypothetical protein
MVMNSNLKIEKVLQVPWSYTLYRNDERFFLSVVCGSVGLFERDIELSEEEIGAYRSLGKEAIDALASKINHEPSSYEDRHIKGFSKWPVKTL